jgi:hypothetical protein
MNLGLGVLSGQYPAIKLKSDEQMPWLLICIVSPLQKQQIGNKGYFFYIHIYI